MTVSLIAAMGSNRVIGIDNRLPWDIPADLQYFKDMTRGKPVIMGRKTYQSMGEALPRRPNIVLSRDPAFRPEDATVVATLEDAIEVAAEEAPGEEIMIIGGEGVYREALDIADKIYLTEIDLAPQGDTFFPPFDKAIWQETSRRPQQGPPAYSFVIYEKKMRAS